MVRHRPVVREDGFPGGHDGPVNRSPGCDRTRSRVGAGAPSVIRSGAPGWSSRRRIRRQLRGGRGRVERRARRLEQQVGPGPRHHVHVLGAPAAGEQPAPAADLARQPVDRGARGPPPVDAQRQVGDGSSRRESQPRSLTGSAGRRPGRPGTTAWKARSHPASPVPVELDVDRRPVGVRAAGLTRPPGPGEQGLRVLVHADGQHARVVPQGCLHTVAAVGVHVDVGVRSAPWLSSQAIATAGSL